MLGTWETTASNFCTNFGGADVFDVLSAHSEFCMLLFYVEF